VRPGTQKGTKLPVKDPEQGKLLPDTLSCPSVLYSGHSYILQFWSYFIAVHFLSLFFREKIHKGLSTLEQVVPEGYTNMQFGFEKVRRERFPQMLAHSLENYLEYLTISSMCLHLFQALLQMTKANSGGKLPVPTLGWGKL
jgi:hypothetical protein